MKIETKQMGDLWVGFERDTKISVIAGTEHDAIKGLKEMYESNAKIAERSESRWYNSTFAESIAILFLCLGIGTCSALNKGHIKINAHTEIRETKK